MTMLLLMLMLMLVLMAMAASDTCTDIRAASMLDIAGYDRCF